LLDEDDTNYKMFNLLNKEFTFDVDMSTLPCGLNGALYFVEMSADGGLSEFSSNKAGSAYGTGYCDSQCPQYVTITLPAVSQLLNTTFSSATSSSSTVWPTSRAGTQPRVTPTLVLEPTAHAALRVSYIFPCSGLSY